MCDVRVDVWDICILLSNEMSTISELHVFLVGLSEMPLLNMFLVNMFELSFTQRVHCTPIDLHLFPIDD